MTISITKEDLLTAPINVEMRVTVMEQEVALIGIGARDLVDPLITDLRFSL